MKIRCIEIDIIDDTLWLPSGSSIIDIKPISMNCVEIIVKETENSRKKEYPFFLVPEHADIPEEATDYIGTAEVAFVMANNKVDCSNWHLFV